MKHPSSLSRQIPQSPALRTLALSASSRLSSNGRVSEAKIRNPLRDWHCHVMSFIQTLPAADRIPSRGCGSRMLVARNWSRVSH